MNYVFICGCPRSGTTALWRLVAAHTDIAVGVERYALKGFSPESFTPALFEEERFFRIEEGDTFYDDLDKFDRYYGELRPRFSSTTLRGDKVPQLYEHLPELYSALPNSKVIFIVRNILDVASSYNARAEDLADGAWRRDQNYVQAVKDWNRSLRATVKALEEGRSMYCLDYERLFQPDFSLTSMFDYLGLSVTPAVAETHQKIVERSQQLELARNDRLTGMQKRHILRRAALAPYRELIDHCEKLSPPSRSAPTPREQ